MRMRYIAYRSTPLTTPRSRKCGRASHKTLRSQCSRHHDAPNTKGTVMKTLYALTYCLVSGVIEFVVGAVAGVGIAGILMRPEEAVILVQGVGLGGPAGAVLGGALGIIAMWRRGRTNRRN